MTNRSDRFEWKTYDMVEEFSQQWSKDKIILMGGTSYSCFMMEPPERIRTLTQNWRLLSSQMPSEVIVDLSKMSFICTSSWLGVTPVVRAMVGVGVRILLDVSTAQFLPNSSIVKLRPVPTWYLSVISSVIESWKSVSIEWNMMSQLPSWAFVVAAMNEMAIHIMLNKVVGGIGSNWIDWKRWDWFVSCPERGASFLKQMPITNHVAFANH